MDLCTYLEFRRCMRNPQLCLRTLGDMLFDDSTLACTEHFVECAAEVFNCRYMVYAPLSLDSIHFANHAAQSLEGKEDLVRFKVLAREMILSNPFASYCSLIVENLPQGKILSEAIYTFSYSHLMAGLQDLKRRLVQSGVCHRNLTPENIIVDENYVWHPIRWYYATSGKRKDYKAFRLLEERIRECAVPDDMAPHLNLIMSQGEIDYPGKRFPIRERRRRVITERGTGFVDDRDVMVIEDVYRRATDFQEDRAVVTLKSGLVGVINRHGRYIIPPEYDKIIFDVATGDSKAYKGVGFAVLDYFGNRKD
ncbi:MAG: WG repeat-containing protein [Alistipes sp.]|nr:WG repeat-containing protein [Alistipes sp.]